MSIRIKYFTHGTTTDNICGLATGWNEGELSPLGIQQIQGINKQVQDEHFDVVISSDLQRAVQTTKLLFNEENTTIIYDQRLRECNYGVLNGKDKELVDYLEHIDEPFINGESMRHVEQRIRELLHFLQENYDHAYIAFVGHRAPQLALEVCVHGKSWEEAIHNDWRTVGKWQPGWLYKFEK